MKKTYYIQLFLLLLLLTNCTHREVKFANGQKILIPFENLNGKWGFKDNRSQAVIIAANYDFVHPFINNRAIVGYYSNGYENYPKFGIIDTLNHFVKLPVYDDIRLLDFGYYKVEELEYSALLDSSFHQITPFDYNRIKILTPHYAKVERDQQTGLYSLTEKREVIPSEYEDIELLTNRYVEITKNRKKGIFDLKTEKQIVGTIYDQITVLDKDNAIVENERKKGVFNLKLRKETIYPEYDTIVGHPDKSHFDSKYSDNIDVGPDVTFIEGSKKSHYTYFNKWGKMILPESKDLELTSGSDLKNGYGIFRKRCCEYHFYAGIIDSSGQQIVPLKYMDLEGVDGNNQIFWTHFGKNVKLYKFNSQLIFSGKYLGGPHDTLNFSEGLMVVSHSGKDGAINTEGQLVIPYMYDSFVWWGFHKGFAMVYNNKKSALIDKHNRIIMPFDDSTDYKVYNDSSIRILSYKNKWENRLSRFIKYEAKILDLKSHKVILAIDSCLDIKSLPEGYYEEIHLKTGNFLYDKWGKKIIPTPYHKLIQIKNDIISFKDNHDYCCCYNIRTQKLYKAKEITYFDLKYGFYIECDSLRQKIKYVDTNNGVEYMIPKKIFDRLKGDD